MNFARDIKNRVVNYIARKFLKLKHISYRIVSLSVGARYPAVEGGAADALWGVARGQGRGATPRNCRAQGDQN